MPNFGGLLQMGSEALLRAGTTILGDSLQGVLSLDGASSEDLISPY
jgi:hypothetical protein